MKHHCPMCGEQWNDDRCDVCGWHEGKQLRYSEPRPRQRLITARVCGGKQALICRVTGKEHDMSAVVRFKDGGGSVACKDCGVTAMQLDLMGAP